MDTTLLLIIIIAFIILFYVITYNTIITVKNKVEESYSTIDVMFQNRYDLIPNLVEVVKQYATHEKELLENVTKLRSDITGNQDVTKEKLEKENELSGTLKSIFALSENYPDLKANQNFINLQNEWTEMEDKMQAARRGYNSAVRDLNNKKETIPSNIVAATMSLKDYPLFEAAEEARKSINAKELF